MRLLEYESKEILARRGIPTPAGIVMSRPGLVTLTPRSLLRPKFFYKAAKRLAELSKPWIKRIPNIRSSN